MRNDQRKNEREERIARVTGALLGMQRHSWEQGCAMQAFLENDQSELLIPMAYEAVNRQTPDGRAGVIGVSDAVTDPCAVGEGLLAAADLTGNEALKEGADRLLAWALELAPRSAAGVLYHLDTGQEFWVDSMYMLPPFLLAAGQEEAAFLNLHGYWDALWDRRTGLLFHIWDEQRQVMRDPSLWGTGCGWALAALARMIRMLEAKEAGPDQTGEAAPADREMRERELAWMKERCRALLDSVLAYERPDGWFPNVLDQPDSFPELALSQMCAYTIYEGIRDGWLTQWPYLAAAERMYRAAAENVTPWGFVRPVCGAPFFDRPGISPEAQAFHLLMDGARERFQK